MRSPENQSEMTMPDRLDLSRRDFGKLTLAALAGMAAGTATVALADDKTAALKNPLFSDPHVCRGLNTCKGKGAGKKNACAGMGQCATAAKHGCGSQNECKGQGGCGEHPGENTCKGQGECSVPHAFHRLEEGPRTVRSADESRPARNSAKRRTPRRLDVGVPGTAPRNFRSSGHCRVSRGAAATTGTSF